MSESVLNEGETLLEPAADAGAPIKLSLDADAEQADARLRSAAALVAAGAGVWLFCVSGSWWLRATALASAAFAARWLVVVRRAMHVSHESTLHFLEITPQRITLARGIHQRSVPIERIQRIELDEDSFTVVIRMHDGSELAIDPIYGGLGLRELGEMLQRYVQAAHSRAAAFGTEDA
jgi:hypothetical protein